MTPSQVYETKKELEKGIRLLCRDFENKTDTVVTKIVVRNEDNNGCLEGTKEVEVTSEDDYCIHKA